MRVVQEVKNQVISLKFLPKKIKPRKVKNKQNIKREKQ